MSKKDVEFLMRTSMYYKAWKDCGSVMKEPEAGYYAKILSTFEKPILMIHGSKDFRSGEEVFKKSAKNTEFAIVEGADHMVMMDPLYKKEFGDKMREFADKVTASITDL
jgi:pimeloyl-ACP methyl ester carboxylesterase